jgi:hypothetical protein
MSDEEDARVLRQAAETVVDALRAHLQAVLARSGESDRAVHEAYEVLREAFLGYDDILLDRYDEVLPVDADADDDPEEEPDDEDAVPL